MKKFDSQAGLGMVEVIVAATVLGVIAIGATRLMSNTFSAVKSASDIDELVSIRKNIRDNMSCQTTLGLNALQANAPCTGQPLILKRADGTVFDKIQNQWEMEASCKNKEIEIVVRFVGLTQNAWKEKRPLFKSPQGLCRSFFVSNACPAGLDVIGTAGPTPVCGRKITGGGAYETRSFDTKVCRSPNPMTGTCTCPVGYSPVQVSSWKASPTYVPAWPWTASYCDQPPGTGGGKNPQPYTPPGGCGYVAYVCFPSN